MSNKHTTSTFNFSELLEIVAAAVPDRPALICGEEVLSYAQLTEQIDRLAARLLEHKIAHGQTVGLQMSNSSAYVVGFFAACKVSAVPFNINYKYAGAELEYLYKNSDIAALLYNESGAQAVHQAAANSRTPKLMISVGKQGTPQLGTHRYEDLIAEPASSLAAISRADDDLLIIYTGGTTGLPKGVMWPHKSLFYGALGAGGWFHPAGAVEVPEDLTSRVLEGPWIRMFPVAPLMHGAALWSALSSLLVGHTLILNDQETFSAQRIWALAEQHQANIMAIVGDAMAMPMVEALEAEPTRWALPALVNVGSGGAIFSQDLQARLKKMLPNIQTSSSLGATETGTMGPGTRETNEGIMRYDARPDLTVLLDGKPAVAGEIGIIARRGYLPVGYYGDASKSAETFINIDGVDHALGGDAARLEEDGSITVLGRGSGCINTGGEKVYPEEVEQALKSHPAISDALVVGIPHPRWTQQVAAVVAIRPGQNCDFETLKTHCAKVLADFKVPKEVLFKESVQRTIVGKPDYVWAKSQFA